MAERAVEQRMLEVSLRHQSGNKSCLQVSGVKDIVVTQEEAKSVGQDTLLAWLTTGGVTCHRVISAEQKTTTLKNFMDMVCEYDCIC